MRFLVCLLLLVALCAPCVAQAPEVPPALKGVHRIVCLGDSITEQGEMPGGYVWLLRHYLAVIYPQRPIEVINAGISGHRSNDMLARFQRDVLDKKPDLVTISVGVNDVWHGFFDNHPLGDGPRGIPLDAYRSNVEAMVTQAEKAGARVVLLSTTVIHEDLHNRENAKLVGYNAALQEIARSHNALFVDYQRPFRALITVYRNRTGGRDNLLTYDGVHMNVAGNRVMANTLLSGLGVSSEARAAVQAKIEADLRAHQ
ncbi:MAG TPA: SGNH/GDSL hydrolase family protein [Chthonomonadaceae bacterium]|nr:SGNH/GDSL hydrolase family protein [Chthonomonadaceae bacterium]